MFAEKFFGNLSMDMITSNDSEESIEKLTPGGAKFQAAITDLGKALLQAAKIGSTEKVHELMSRGAPFTADWLGTTPLHLAARYNHVETCKMLLRAGISKDSKTKVDRTPLHLAVFHGHIEIVELLLSNNCEVDAKDMLKMTALHWAVNQKHSKIVEMLLQKGADPNVVSKFDKTPIQLALESGQGELWQVMLLANQMREASNEQVGVQEATDSLMYELQQHKERHRGPPTDGVDSKSGGGGDGVGDDDDVEDNITMDLSSDSSSRLTEQQNGADDSRDDADHLIEREDSMSDAMTNLEQSTDTDPKNLDSGTLQMLKEHGIALIPSDDTGSLITSAIQSGRKIVLSEAGKFALNETRNLQQQQQTRSVTSTSPQSQPRTHPTKAVHHSPAAVHTMTLTANKPKTLKIIKKTTSTTGSYAAAQNQQVHHVQQQRQQPGQPVHVMNAGPTATIRTNQVLKVLSPEEFKQICSGDVGIMKRAPSAEYKKALPSTSVRIPVGGRPQILSTTTASKQVGKYVMTKSGQRIPLTTTAGMNVISARASEDLVKAKLATSSGVNGLSSATVGAPSRHIITSADGVKRLRTATGMEIISTLPTKLPQDTTVSVETHGTTRTVSRPHQRIAINNHVPVAATTVTSSNTTGLIVEVLERQMVELKKLIEDLRKQFELSQKQNEEYRTRVEKLEKEVRTLKQQSSNGSSFIEIIRSD